MRTESATEDGAVLVEQVLLATEGGGPVGADLRAPTAGPPASGRIGCQPVAAIDAWPGADRTYSTSAFAADGISAAPTTPIGLYIEIAPSVGQTSSIGEPLAIAARAELSRVIPTLNRPWATPVTTSSGVGTWTAPSSLSAR